MANTPVVTVRLEPELRERLDRLAKAQRRSRSFMATEATREYVKVNEWQIEETRKALAETDRGEFASRRVMAGSACQVFSEGCAAAIQFSTKRTSSLAFVTISAASVPEATKASS
jgi:predicted transcriptional regulator